LSTDYSHFITLVWGASGCMG